MNWGIKYTMNSKKLFQIVLLLIIIPKSSFPIEFDFGMTAGLSFNTLYGDDENGIIEIGGNRRYDLKEFQPSEYTLTKRVSFTPGIYLNIRVNNILAIRLLGVDLSLRGGKLEKDYAITSTINNDTTIRDYDAEYKMKMNYLDFSAMLFEFRFPFFKKFTPYFLIGPQVSFLLGNSRKETKYKINKVKGYPPFEVEIIEAQLSKEYEEDLENYIDNLDLSIILNYGAKIKAGKGNLLLQLKHIFGTASIIDNYYKDLLIKSRSFSFSIGYEFYLKGKLALYPHNKGRFKRKQL